MYARPRKKYSPGEQDLPANEYSHGYKWETQVQNVSVNWYDMSIREKERQMKLIGHSQVRSSNSDSKVMEEAISLIEQEMLDHVLILYIGKEFSFRRRCSFNLVLNPGLIAGGREGRETRHTIEPMG